MVLLVILRAAIQLQTMREKKMRKLIIATIAALAISAAASAGVDVRQVDDKHCGEGGAYQFEDKHCGEGGA